jgi:hypothetical protein
MTVRYDFAFSRRDASEVCISYPSRNQREQGYPKRGAGKAGCPMHPQPRV